MQTPAKPARPLVPGPDPRCPADPIGRPSLRRTEVRFVEAKLSVAVEVAETESHRQRGLMYRKSMAPEEGMLFVFEREQPLAFWMKNTCISLDMLFIDDSGTIVGIEENVPTMNRRTYKVACPSRFVLEVNAGWSRAHGVVAGQRVMLEGL